MRLKRVITVLFGLAMLAAACTSNGDDTTTGSVTSDPTDETTTPTTSTSTTSTTTTEAPPETRPTQNLEGAWAESWQILLGIGPSGLTNAGLASDEAAEALGRLGLDGAITAEHYPRLDVITGRPDKGPAEVALTDCVLFDNHPPVWLTGNMTREDESQDWTIASVDIIDPFGNCVPKEVADAAIAGAQAFWDAQTEYWDPADPDHPLIAETTTREYRTFIEDLLQSHQTDGVRFTSDGSAASLGIFVIDNDSSLVVQNCFAPGQGYGWFGSDGNHIDGSTPVVEGQTSYSEYTMIKESAENESDWRVSNVVSSVDDGCDPSSTVDLLPVH